MKATHSPGLGSRLGFVIRMARYFRGRRAKRSDVEAWGRLEQHERRLYLYSAICELDGELINAKALVSDTLEFAMRVMAAEPGDVVPIPASLHQYVSGKPEDARNVGDEIRALADEDGGRIVDVDWMTSVPIVRIDGESVDSIEDYRDTLINDLRSEIDRLERRVIKAEIDADRWALRLKAIVSPDAEKPERTWIHELQRLQGLIRVECRIPDTVGTEAGFRRFVEYVERLESRARVRNELEPRPGVDGRERPRETL